MADRDQEDHTPTASAAGEARWPDPVRWLTDNPGLAVSALFGAVTIIRISVTSGGSVVTARAIIRYGDTATIILNTAAAVTPFVLYVALLGVVARYRRKERLPPRAEAAAITLSPLAIVLVPYLFLGYVVFFEIVVPWYFNRRRKKRGDEPRQFVGSDLGAVLLGLVFVVLISDTMWLPPEAITTGERRVLGYVLSESDQRLVVLQDSPREVLLAPADARRQFCSGRDERRSWLGRTLADEFNRNPRPAYPRCEKLTETEPGGGPP